MDNTPLEECYDNIPIRSQGTVMITGGANRQGPLMITGPWLQRKPPCHSAGGLAVGVLLLSGDDPDGFHLGDGVVGGLGRFDQERLSIDGDGLAFPLGRFALRPGFALL